MRGHRLFRLEELDGVTLHPADPALPAALAAGRPGGVPRGDVDAVKDVLGLTADYATRFLETLDDRPVRPESSIDELREALGGPLPAERRDPVEVISELIEAAEPGLMATSAGRFFGFVIGGALPAPLAADWLTSTWDQNAAQIGPAPSAGVVEEVVLAWLRELLLLPAGVSAAS